MASKSSQKYLESAKAKGWTFDKEITPDQLRDKLLALADEKDPEAAHSKADDLLCTTLEGLGYVEAVDVFRRMVKWYS